ncbi:MAG: ATP-binding cassette domain-containing protein [Clostridia bacterium]|nr:ATP-binding cassette domain-containing protein [Clostridia bacterium]
MIELVHLHKTFETADGTVEALKDINLSIADGDIFGIIGMSGAGKSTLVRCINMLERPTSGSVIVGGEDMAAMSPAKLREKRRSITMIFQQFNLLMQRTCLKNVCFPMELEGVGKKEARKKAMELLSLVGLPDKAKSYPAQLSGGQQQRVAIARALATNPQVLLCDEATSALDPNTTHAILELIRDINQKLGITVVVITHQMSVVEDICNRVAILDEGRVVEQGNVKDVFANPKSAAAKKLVFPNGEETVLPPGAGETRLRVLFNGSETADLPLIATMAAQHGVLAKILGASTRSLGAQAFGEMLISVPDADAEKALAFLRAAEGIVVEEVKGDVQ